MAQTGCVEKLQEVQIRYLHALLRIATALAHAHNYLVYYLSILGLAHVTLDTRPCDRLRVTEPERAWERGYQRHITTQSGNTTYQCLKSLVAVLGKLLGQLDVHQFSSRGRQPSEGGRVHHGAEL